MNKSRKGEAGSFIGHEQQLWDKEISVHSFIHLFIHSRDSTSFISLSKFQVPSVHQAVMLGTGNTMRNKTDVELNMRLKL